MSESSAQQQDEPDAVDGLANTVSGPASRWLAGLGDAFFALDVQARFTYLSERAEELLLRGRGQLLGRRLWDEFPECADSVMHRELARALALLAGSEFAGYYPAAGAWLTVRAWPGGDGLFVCFRTTKPPLGAGDEVRAFIQTPAPAPLPHDEPYYALAEALAQIAWTAQPDGRVDHVNQRRRQYTGSDPAATQPAGDWLAALHPADQEPVRLRWTAAVQTGAAFTCELRLHRARDGAYRWHAAAAAPVRDRTGRIVKWFATCADVDEQRRAEAGLRFLARASETLTVSLDYEATLTGIARLAVPLLADWCIVDELEPDGGIRRLAIVHADPKLSAVAWEMERRFPMDPDARFGPASVLRTGRGELLADLSPQALTDQTETAGRLAYARRLGLRSLVCVPLIARGRTMGALTFVAGDSGRRYDAADLALLEDLAHRTALAVDNARLYAAEQQARRAAERSAGRTARLQSVTAALSEALTPAQVAQVIVDQTLAALDATVSFVSTIARDTEGECALLLHSAGFSDDVRASVRRIPLGVGRPLTDAILRGEPLWLESGAAIATSYPILDPMRMRTGLAALAVLPLLAEGRVIGVIALGFRAARAFHEEDRALALALARQCAQALERARLYDAELAARAAAEAATEEVQRTQALVVESERLRALGEMASGIAHDFNNILAVILGRCEVLLNGSPAADPIALTRHLAVVRQAARDGEETVQRLQAFSGVSRRPATGRIDLPALVREVIEFTRPRWKDAAQQRGRAIQVETDLPPMSPIAGNPAELREALVNLVFNALDAMPQGGKLGLGLRREGESVTVWVSDDGVGMSEAVRRRVFEPFFSTKGTRGAGLGLSMSYGIITRLGGHITVRSGAGEGSIFTITLPCRAAGVEPPGVRPATAPPCSILLVDDEQQVLETTRLMLELDGHQVTTAGSGAEALALLREGGEPGEESIYDVVLTDLGMPGMNGLQLLAAIRAAGYRQPCLLVTGWGVELAGPDVAASGAQAVLPKPFALAELRAALAEILLGA